MAKQQILLESGTNELEIMEFKIAGETFGINVAKVREIMIYQPVKPMQHSHPAIEGIFKPRDLIMTVIDLPKYLGLSGSQNTTKDLFIIAYFNKIHVAFHVHSVEGIARISWENIEKPDRTIYGGNEGIATGIAEYAGRLITILDFEKIIYDISPQTGIQLADLEALGVRPQRENVTVLIVEDSVLLCNMITDSLHKAGYVNLVKTANGQEAWEFLCNAKNDGPDIQKHCSLVITDIEMPQMDGHHLTKLIKTDSQLKTLPVIIFSSLIDEEMYKKGQQLGADAQLTKPEIAKLVSLVDEHILC
ncbi:MAG TPA: chemotaxis protein [Patescibacteria group bacterium]|nr:chemotaxis protein [Patescibacteria group bacterium]